MEKKYRPCNKMEGTTAFWGMVINNYDDTDLALVQQGYPDYIRQLVYTKEVGAQGTPHIQAYIKLYRAHRLSYVKKLFPRGSFKFLSNDEYKLNAQRYSQKLDSTADSPAVIQNNPFPDPVVELVSVIEDVITNLMEHEEYHLYKADEVLFKIKMIERRRVVDKPSMAKFYVSATYRAVKKEFWLSICENVCRTHAQTHKDEKLSQQEGITNARSSSPSPPEEAEDDGFSTSSEESGVSEDSF